MFAGYGLKDETNCLACL